MRILSSLALVLVSLLLGCSQPGSMKLLIPVSGTPAEDLLGRWFDSESGYARLEFLHFRFRDQIMASVTVGAYTQHREPTSVLVAPNRIELVMSCRNHEHRVAFQRIVSPNGQPHLRRRSTELVREPSPAWHFSRRLKRWLGELDGVEVAKVGSSRTGQPNLSTSADATRGFAPSGAAERQGR